MKVTVVCDKCLSTNTFDYERLIEMGQNSSLNIQKHIKLLTRSDTRIFAEKCKGCGNPFHIKITCKVTQEAGNSMFAKELP